MERLPAAPQGPRSRRRAIAAAELVEQRGGEKLSYYAYPSTHWR